MFTNNTDLSLPLQLFMVHSDYDHISDAAYISATSLLKPTKATILGMRIKNRDIDALDLVASSVGTASHDRLEKAFLNGNHIINMKKLGYSNDVIKNMRINPEIVEDFHTPVYLERRSIKSFKNWQIGGKFDFVFSGMVRDLKTTKVFSYMKQEFEDYRIQLSIYKWLNPDIITDPYGAIDFIFTDWKAFEVGTKTNYPAQPALSIKILLMTDAEVEIWLDEKLSNLEKYVNSAQINIPDCTNKELWQDPPKYAYFKNASAKRATKVFDNYAEAQSRLLTDGSVGKIDTRLGTPKRCNYCFKADCEQAQNYILEGVLEA